MFFTVLYYLIIVLLVIIFGFMSLYFFRIYQRDSKINIKKNKKLLSPLSEKLDIEEEKLYGKQLKAFIDTGNNQQNGASYDESAEVGVSIISNHDIFTVNDLIRKNSKVLFYIHRHAAYDMEGGLAIRMTVQLNLFGGSVANLGSKEQIQFLQEEIFDKGNLGCFALTERGAGVLSGLVVETTATYIKDEEHFVLHSPTVSSEKIWISSGLMAKYAVVIARLILPGNEKEDLGPHAFLVDLTTDGVKRTDMDRKVDFNPLDNAIISFDNVILPRKSILSGISYIDEDGNYQLVDESNPFSFVVVAQRLLSGRICISGAAISYLDHIVKIVEDYSSKRPIITGRDETTQLSEMSFMKDKLEKIKSISIVLNQYVRLLEEEFMSAPDNIPADLVDKIACAKVVCIEYALRALVELKESVGSYCLFEHSCFGVKNDLLYVFRFAEGDSNILSQKMVRDILKKKASLPAMLQHLVSLPLSLIKNKDNVGLQKLSFDFDLLKLLLRFSNKKGSEKMKCWFDSHELISSVARKHTLLTIHDTLHAKHSETKEFNIFKKYLINPL